MFRRRHVTPHPDRILIVCTGNICRSPYIAALLRAALPELDIVSAGVAAVVGEPPTPEIQALLHERGLVVRDDDRAQSLTKALVRSAALVVTATRQHRVEVVRLDPTAASRAFTLRELARLLADAPPGVGAADAAAFAAGSTDDSVDHDDDLDDPFGLGEADYLEMAEKVNSSVASLTPTLRALPV